MEPKIIEKMSTDQELARKLLVLDARDKVLRERMTKQTELSHANSYTGTCEDMCPERERYTRLGYRLSIFERNKTTNQSDEYAMVKEYRRAGADQEEPLPHDLRTPKALEITVDYLICNIMDDYRSSSLDYALEWYDFLWDRLRAIRKDITQQNICNELAAILVERCTRFHVHSCYAMNRIKDFDVDMNKRNLNDCLQMLRQLYDDIKVSTGSTCEGELEFQKYDILLHLGEDALSTNSLMKKANQNLIKEMKFITYLFNAYSNNDYFNFFKIMKKADYMTSCILSLYVNKVRLNAMKIIVSACQVKQEVLYPANMIIDSLGFDDIEDLKSFTSHLEIDIQEKDSKYYLILRKEHLINIRMASTSMPAVRSRNLVEDKMNGLSIGQLVYGRQDLPPNPYKMYPLQTSIHLYEKLSIEQPMIIDREPIEEVSDQLPEQEPMQEHNESIQYEEQGQQKKFIEPAFDQMNITPIEEVLQVTYEQEADQLVQPTDMQVSDNQTPQDQEQQQEVVESQTVVEQLERLDYTQQPESLVQEFMQYTPSDVAKLMPVGKMPKSKRLPRFAPIPPELNSVNEVRKKTRTQSKRKSDINSIKECALDEEDANIQFFRIVRMII